MLRNSSIVIITGRNEIVAKVMFLQVSVIHSVHGGGLRRTPPAGRTPRTREKPPPNQADPPRQGEPPGPGRPPPREEDCSIRSMSGRYASYWNAFLSYLNFNILKIL